MVQHRSVPGANTSNLTQDEVAKRMGISTGFAQQDRCEASQGHSREVAALLASRPVNPGCRLHTLCEKGIEIKSAASKSKAAKDHRRSLLDDQVLATSRCHRKIALDDDDEAANVGFAAQVASFVLNSIDGLRSRSAARKANSPAGRPRSRSKAFFSCWRVAR
jgi:hypothetical protein